MSIEEFIKIISEEVSVRVSDITPQSNLVDDLGIDSMSLLEIVMRTEELLGREFENLEFENIHTVKQAYDYLLQLPVSINQLITQFAAEGCLYVPGFFSEEECRLIKTAYQESIKLSPESFLRQTTTRYETHNFSEDGFITNPLLNVHLLADTYLPFSERVLQLLASDKLRDLLSKVFKAAPVLVQTMYFESSRGTNLHVDSDFIDSTQEGSMIGCWIPLEDIDEEAGRFCYYPKSFLLKEEGHFDSESTGLFQSYRELCTRSVQNFQSESKSMLLDNAMKSKKLMAALLKKSNLEMRVDEVKTGDLILFNSLTIHGSIKPRMTGKSRNSLTAHFIPGNTNLLKFQQDIIPLNILQENELLYHV